MPFLVAGAAVLLLVQPRISARPYRSRRSGGPRRPASRAPSVLPLGLFVVGVYDGYFGAASGVMTLAVLMVTVETRLLRANAVKNALLGVADVVAAVVFVIFGPVLLVGGDLARAGVLRWSARALSPDGARPMNCGS